MSPELTLRPSLSGWSGTTVVSPELTLRPSLSGRERSTTSPAPVRANAPAFVERCATVSHTNCGCVAGANAPAFVERRDPPRWNNTHGHVSPELTLRPSLSVATGRPRAASRSRVAGANAPAFVERTGTGTMVMRCRRS